MSDETIVVECRGPDGWYTVTEDELPIQTDHWGAEMRLRESDK